MGTWKRSGFFHYEWPGSASHKWLQVKNSCQRASEVEGLSNREFFHMEFWPKSSYPDKQSAVYCVVESVSLKFRETQ